MVSGIEGVHMAAQSATTPVECAGCGYQKPEYMEQTTLGTCPECGGTYERQ